MRATTTAIDTLRVDEHRSLTLPHATLNDADVRVLQHLREQKVIGLDRTPSGWRVRAKAAVGVVVLSRTRLVLHPKLEIDGEQLVTWLCYAEGVSAPRHQDLPRRWRLGDAGHAEVALAGLLATCRALLRQGLRRDYAPARREEQVLRGRLDVRAQATRRFGAVDRLHVTTFERDERTWENLLCGAALAKAADHAETLLRVATQPADRKRVAELARELGATAKRFPRPAGAAALAALLAQDHRRRYNRLTHRYRAAHTWARLVLRGGGVTDLLTERGLRADSMTVNMNVLWEAVVRKMAGDAAAAFGGEPVRRDDDPGITTSGDLRRSRGEADPAFIPDVLVRLPGDPPRFLPIDAKYKSYAGRRVEADDRHQLLTYIAGYSPPDAPLAAVVYPSPEGERRRTLTVTGPRGQLLGVIEVLGLDTGLPPERAAEPLRQVVAGFAAATRA
ncbi:5-methylcytosine restriction system specificity protein McrC [Streptomyces sp. 4N509B]|uniref:5-methylcytosine restriction system specificity protein McrC n=1 Tax=Streptomyces sp. 4N509B TaxID=3457413 RepID=UPI003FD05144